LTLSNTKAEQFRKEPSHFMTINSINTMLSSVIENYDTEITTKLWHAIETEISLKDCDIYSYTPDLDSDPNAEDDAPPAMYVTQEGSFNNY
jgi:hypothetical protein